MKATTIRCHCGHRIYAKDILQKSTYVRVFGPTLMYLKFRCSRCKRLGEKIIEQDQWDESLLRDAPTEMSVEEKRRFDRMGKITADEVIDFHFQLEEPDALKKLAEEIET